MASQHEKPDPDSSEYQQQVSKSIKTLVFGQRPRDPIMSGASTGRLIIEGVVENLRIYRLYKEERAWETNKKNKKAKGKEKTNDNSHEHKRRQRHRSQSPSHGGRRHRSHGSNREISRRYHRHHSTDTGGNEGEHRRRKRHRHRLKGDGRNKDREGSRDRDNNQNRGDHSAYRGLLSPSTHNLTSGMMNVAEAQLGPDGTPFGSLPTRGKGVSIAAHAKTIYRNIMAEQDAGHRNKGFAEKHIGAFFQRRDAKGAIGGRDKEGKPLISAKSEGQERSWDRQERHRGKQRRPKSRECERKSSVEDEDFERYQNAEEPVAARAESPVSAQSARSERQPTPFAQRPSSGPVRPVREPALSVRSASSVRGAQIEGRESTTGASHPAIRVQSPTPPDHVEFVRSPTPVTQGPISRKQSRELRDGGSETPVRDLSFLYSPSSPLVPVPPLAIETPCPAALTAVNIPVLTVPADPPVPPPPPPTDPLPTLDPVRGALMASILSGAAKLRKVPEEKRKDEDTVRKDEICINHYTKDRLVYEETPHSHEVEALERAQAVKEKERREEEEESKDAENHRTATPLTAPHPRVVMPDNLQDKLAAKPQNINLSKEEDQKATEASSGDNPGGLRSCPSSESWRTDMSVHEDEHRIPDWNFRENLGNSLLTGETPQQQPTTPFQAPPKADTPAADVFINLAAKVTADEPRWGFENLPKDDSGSHGKSET